MRLILSFIIGLVLKVNSMMLVGGRKGNWYSRMVKPSMGLSQTTAAKLMEPEHLQWEMANSGKEYGRMVGMFLLKKSDEI